MNSLSIPTAELQTAVKHLHKLLSKIKPKPAYPILDVIIKLNSVELRLIGMSQIIKTEHKSIFSFTIPFHDIYVAALGTGEAWFNAEITNGKITLGNRHISSDHIKLFHSENLLKFELAMNSNIIEILSLRNKFSNQELEDKNYLEVVEKEEESLDQEIHNALKYLSKYGITYTMLKKIISQNIADNSPC